MAGVKAGARRRSTVLSVAVAWVAICSPLAARADEAGDEPLGVTQGLLCFVDVWQGVVSLGQATLAYRPENRPEVQVTSGQGLAGEAGSA